MKLHLSTDTQNAVKFKHFKITGKFITLTKIVNIYTNLIPKIYDLASACTGKLMDDFCDFASSTSTGTLAPINCDLKECPQNTTKAVAMSTWVSSV